MIECEVVEASRLRDGCRRSIRSFGILNNWQRAIHHSLMIVHVQVVLMDQTIEKIVILFTIFFLSS